MIRSFLLPLLLLTVPARADLIYVLNSGDASISLIDGLSRTELRRIPTLREPHHLALTPDGRSLVVGDSGGNELMFLDPATAEPQRRERISNPYHLGYSPDGRALVIASLRRDQVDLYDAATLALQQRHRLPDKPSHIAFSPDSRIVFVTLQGSGSVAAISLETREVLWHADVGPEPAGIVWHDVPGVGGRLIVGLMGSDHFAVLDPTTRLVERRIAVGRGAHTVFTAPDGTLWATSRVDSRLTTLDPTTLAPVRSYDVPGGPDCLAFAPDGRVWMTLRWAARIAVLDPVGGGFETVRVGRSPHGIFVQPRAPTANVLAAAAPGAMPRQPNAPASPPLGGSAAPSGQAPVAPVAAPAPAAPRPAAAPPTPEDASPRRQGWWPWTR